MTATSRTCRHCLHPLAVAADARGTYWAHRDSGLTRCPDQPARRRQVAEPTRHPLTQADLALAGGDR